MQKQAETPSNRFHHHTALLEDSLSNWQDVLMQGCFLPVRWAAPHKAFRSDTSQYTACLTPLCCLPAHPMAGEATHWRPEYPSLDDEQLTARFKLKGEFHSILYIWTRLFFFPSLWTGVAWRAVMPWEVRENASPSPATVQREGPPATQKIQNQMTGAAMEKCNRNKETSQRFMCP